MMVEKGKFLSQSVPNHKRMHEGSTSLSQPFEEVKAVMISFKNDEGTTAWWRQWSMVVECREGMPRSGLARRGGRSGRQWSWWCHGGIVRQWRYKGRSHGAGGVWGSGGVELRFVEWMCGGAGEPLHRQGERKWKRIFFFVSKQLQTRVNPTLTRVYFMRVWPHYKLLLTTLKYSEESSPNMIFENFNAMRSPNTMYWGLPNTP